MLSPETLPNASPSPNLSPTVRPPEMEMVEASPPQPNDNFQVTTLAGAMVNPQAMSSLTPPAVPSPNKTLSGHPTQPAVSYKASLSGETTVATKSVAPWMFIGEQDLVSSSFQGEPELIVSDVLKSRLCSPWKKTLMVRLLGRKVSYTYLCSQLRWMWRPVGKMDIMDLEDDVFLATFDNDQDYFKALTGGPWVLLDHYLVVHQWSPAFRVGDTIPRTVTAWVRFPRLPVHFYHKEVLFALGNLIGRTIKLDYHTEHGHRGKFARIAIELDMAKPLRPRVRLDGFWQKVVYENLPHVCFECGIVGHAESVCPKLGRDLTPTAISLDSTAGSQRLPASETEAPASFGP
ncbi:unnamed protein product [Linum trigynum]|uniref:CCHC-type domain-containing protein n=1 Tax=Linum trigynum TaxID=586398 RepID=A0AAV2CUR1_9ROSI